MASASSLSSSLPLPSRHRPRRRISLLPSASLAIPSHRRSLWHSDADSAISTHLLSSLPTSPPPSVSLPILHLLASSPPSAPPALCLAACHLAAAPLAAALGAASALHLMLAAAHAHAALLRRHRPGGAAPAGRFPDGVELMAADGMLPLGFELVARAATADTAAAAVRAVAEMAAAMEAVAEGRLMEAEGGDGREEAVVELTEGRVAGCGAACGAMLGGGGEEAVERMRRFGFYVGMMCGVGGESRAGEFRELAGAELEGMEEERVEVVRGLVDFWYHERRAVQLP